MMMNLNMTRCSLLLLPVSSQASIQWLSTQILMLRWHGGCIRSSPDSPIHYMRQTRPRDRTTYHLAPRRKELQCVAHRRPLPIAPFVVRSVVSSISRPSTKGKSSSIGTVMHSSEFSNPSRPLTIPEAVGGVTSCGFSQ